MLRKIKTLAFFAFLISAFVFSFHDTQAAVPTITGRVRNAETNAPVAGVWVSMTGSGCPSCPSCQINPSDKTKYEQTDSNGEFSFLSVASKDWKDEDGNVGGLCGHPWIGMSIDTNLDGVNDQEKIPALSCTFQDTDGSGNPVTMNVCSPDFGCTSATYSFTVVTPAGWSGYFDSIDNVDFANIPSVVEMPIGTINYYPVVTPNEPPEVEITFPTSPTGSLGVPVNIIARATDDEDGSADRVDFYVNGALIGTDNTPGGGSTFTQSWTPSSLGPNTIRAVATDSDGATGEDTVSFEIVSTDPWWQISRGGAFSKGSIVSAIPTTCVLPLCINSLITPGANNNPGVVIVNGSTDFAEGPSTGTVSPTNEWLVNTSTLTNTFTYNYFVSLSSGKTFNNAGNSLNTGDLNGSSGPSEPYNWVRTPADTDVTINQPINVSKKTIVFVDGDLAINRRIRVNNTKTNFVMFVVNGDIIVSDSLSSTGESDPAIQGVFFANGSFITLSNGTDDSRIVIEGIVAASNIDLRRDLATENVNTPAELFLYQPGFIVNFPPALSTKHLIWKEVAP